MHTYFVYGLNLHTELPLPELLACGANTADVTVCRASISVAASARPGVTSWVEVNGPDVETLCVFDGVGRFLVRQGREIVVDAVDGVDPGLVRHALIGPVMAQLLWQRGLFTLHASVVRIGQRHAAFIGVSGEGKSTTAAALNAAGHALVCDDIAAITWDAPQLRALPGFPRIRLYADSVRGIGEDPAAHPLIHSLIDKRLRESKAFVSTPVALDKLYVLATGAAFAADALPKREAMIELMKHSYNASQLAPIMGFGKHMQMAARVADQVPAYRLERPKDLARLPELVRFVEAHVQA